MKVYQDAGQEVLQRNRRQPKPKGQVSRRRKPSKDSIKRVEHDGMKKSKKQRQEWWNSLSPEQQDKQIERWQKRKAARRRAKSIAEMKRLNITRDCRKCVHGITESCTDDLPQGCEFHYQVKTMVTVTKELLEQGKSWRGAWNTAQLQALGVKTIRFNKGWKRRLIGSEVTQAQVDEFLRLKNKHLAHKKRPFETPDQSSSFERDAQSHMRSIGAEIRQS